LLKTGEQARRTAGGGRPHTISSRRHRQRQSLNRARRGLHHPGTLCPPRLRAARAVPERPSTNHGV